MRVLIHLLSSSYSVLPEWYVHNKPVDDDDAEVAMEANGNELTNGQQARKKPMLGHDSMTVWQRCGTFLLFMVQV